LWNRTQRGSADSPGPVSGVSIHRLAGEHDLVGLAVWVAVLAVPAVVWRRARRRRAQLARQWQWALDQCGRGGADIAFVQRVYQNARHGSKAIIVWRADGVRQDTWFQGWHAPPGVYVVVRGQTGWGPHNRNPHVFFVAPHGVIGWVPGAAPRAWARQLPSLRPARNLHDFSAHRGAHAG
jgi:hypothetical protein